MGSTIRGPASNGLPAVPRLGSDFDETETDGPDHRLRSGVDVQLLVEVRHVVANRLGADPELVGDFLVCQARSSQLQYLGLTMRQWTL